MKKLKAKMLVDFDNEMSIQYSHKARESWKPLDDLIEIDLVQCITPEHPDFSKTIFVPVKCLNNSDSPRRIRCNSRTFTERAILQSFYNLWCQLAEGDDFLILEHDAYLNPDQVDHMRKLLLSRHEYRLMIFGSAMECVWMDSQVAKNAVTLCKYDYTHNMRGPLWIIKHAALTDALYWDRSVSSKGKGSEIFDLRKLTQNWLDKGLITSIPFEKKTLWPIGTSTLKGGSPKQFISNDANLYGNVDHQNGDYTIVDGCPFEKEEIPVEIVDRPVVQMIDPNVGVTNLRFGNDGNPVHGKNDLKGRKTGAISVDLNS